MPELPQMQALSERLDAEVGGAALEAVEPLGFSALKTVVPSPDSLIGATLQGVSRYAKYLILDFGDKGRILIHLSQAGRLDVEEPPKRTRAKGSVVRLRFSNGKATLVREYGHERKAAWWVLAPGDDGRSPNSVPNPIPTSSPTSSSMATTAAASTRCCATSAPSPASAAATPTTRCGARSCRRTRRSDRSTTTSAHACSRRCGA